MITDPQAIRFCNEVIRPLCEELRAVKAKIDAGTVTWIAIQALVPNNAAEIVEDGRESEGVSRISGADVRAVVAILATVGTAVTDATIGKPCVRALQAE